MSFQDASTVLIPPDRASRDDAVPTTEELRGDLLQESIPTAEYLFLALSSSAIASLGLLSNSVAVIIGAMIVAPLMLPIRGLAFSVLRADSRLARAALSAIVLGCGLAICMSSLLGLLVSMPEFGSEVQARTQPNLLDLGIALAAGAVSGYAKLNKKIGDAIAGTAIAVALMPPICVVGLCIAQGQWLGAWGALLLFITNLVGIAMACMSVFATFDHGRHIDRTRRVLAWTAALTALLIVPLGYSLHTVLRQGQLVAATKRLLVTRTVTFGRQLTLLEARMVWRQNVPEVHVLVRALVPPTPRQVTLLQSFLRRELDQDLVLVLTVSQIQEVRTETASPPAVVAPAPPSATPPEPTPTAARPSSI